MISTIQETQKELYSFIKNQKNIPHSQAFIGDYGRGGFLLGLYQAKLLLFSEEDIALEKLFFHPDLQIIFPEIKNPSSKKEINLLLFYSFIKKDFYQNTEDWFLFLNEKKEGLISVERTKKIFSTAFLKSFKLNKVCIIWGADTLHNAASNKILKLIEEPPQNTYFILIVNKENSLSQTLNSRLQKSYVRPVSTNIILKHLLEKGVEKDRAQIISKQSNGSMGRSFSLLANQEKFLFYEKDIIEVLRNSFLASRKPESWEQLISWSERIAQLSNEKMKDFFSYFISFLRHVFLSNYKEEKDISFFPIYSGFDISKLAPYINNKNIMALISLLEKNTYYIERNANKRILCLNIAISLYSLLK